MQFSKLCRPYWLRKTQQPRSNSGSMPLSCLYRYACAVRHSMIGAVTESLECFISLTCMMQIKQGDPREAASLASALLTSGQPLEVLHFGFQLLQAVVGPDSGHLESGISQTAAAQEARQPS